MRPALAAAALALIAAATPAQLDSQQATAELKASAKAALKAEKAALDPLRTDALAAIEAYETNLAANGYDSGELFDLFNLLNDFVGAVTNEVIADCGSLANSAASTLGNVTDPAVVAGNLPVAFCSGTGSVFDDTRDKLLSNAEKTIAAVVKRLGKTGTLLQKGEGVNLVVVRRALPRSLVDAAPNPSLSTSLVASFGLSIDLALTASRSDTDDDGLVVVGGSANGLGGNVSVQLDGDPHLVVPGSNQRWKQVFTNIPEGNRFAEASPENGGMEDTLAIAVR